MDVFFESVPVGHKSVSTDSLSLFFDIFLGKIFGRL